MASNPTQTEGSRAAKRAPVYMPRTHWVHVYPSSSYYTSAESTRPYYPIQTFILVAFSRRFDSICGSMKPDAGAYHVNWEIPREAGDFGAIQECFDWAKTLLLPFPRIFAGTRYVPVKPEYTIDRICALYAFTSWLDLGDQLSNFHLYKNLRDRINADVLVAKDLPLIWRALPQESGMRRHLIHQAVEHAWVRGDQGFDFYRSMFTKAQAIELLDAFDKGWRAKARHESRQNEVAVKFEDNGYYGYDETLDEQPSVADQKQALSEVKKEGGVNIVNPEAGAILKMGWGRRTGT